MLGILFGSLYATFLRALRSPTPLKTLNPKPYDPKRCSEAQLLFGVERRGRPRGRAGRVQGLSSRDDKTGFKV